MKWLLALWPFISTLSASYQYEFDKQLKLSIDERKVTVKMMQDRLKSISRRENAMKLLVQNMIFPPEDIADEIDLLAHDRRAVAYIINSMKEDR